MTPIQYFVENFSDLVKQMENTSHSQNSINPYHVEGNILAHTCMVYKQAEKENIFVKIASLFHDIGKLYCYEDKENGKRMFAGHEGRSFFESIKYVDQMCEFYEISEFYKATILMLIALHGSMYNVKNSEDYLNKIKAFNRNNVRDLFSMIDCDRNGRISLTNHSNKVFEESYHDFMLDYSMCNYTTELKRKMVVLIGLPSSGKSTYTKTLSESTKVISRDEFVEELGDGKDYNEKFNNVDQREVDRQFDINYNKLLKSDSHIVIDKTNMSKKTRRRFLIDADKHKMEKIAIVFATDIDKCKERNKNRDNKIIPEKVIENMSNRFTFPMGDEFDKIYLNIDGLFVNI